MFIHFMGMHGTSLVSLCFINSHRFRPSTSLPFFYEQDGTIVMTVANGGGSITAGVMPMRVINKPTITSGPLTMGFTKRAVGPMPQGLPTNVVNGTCPLPPSTSGSPAQTTGPTGMMMMTNGSVPAPGMNMRACISSSPISGAEGVASCVVGVSPQQLTMVPPTGIMPFCGRVVIPFSCVCMDPEASANAIRTMMACGMSPIIHVPTVTTPGPCSSPSQMGSVTTHMPMGTTPACMVPGSGSSGTL